MECGNYKKIVYNATKDITKMIRRQAMESINGKMDGLIKEISMTIIETDTDSCTTVKRLYIEDIGRTVNKTLDNPI
jgi:hypothetical protein